MRDEDPISYAQYLIGVSAWLTAVECALVGVASWSGFALDDGAPAPINRAVLQSLFLDEKLSDQVMAVLTEAAVLLVIEGEPFGASPNGSSEPETTA